MVSIIFAGFQMAGEFLVFKWDLDTMEVLDPVSQSSLPVISTLKKLNGDFNFFNCRCA